MYIIFNYMDILLKFNKYLYQYDCTFNNSNHFKILKNFRKSIMNTKIISIIL